MLSLVLLSFVLFVSNLLQVTNHEGAVKHAIDKLGDLGKLQGLRGTQGRRSVQGMGEGLPGCGARRKAVCGGGCWVATPPTPTATLLVRPCPAPPTPVVICLFKD